MPIAGVEQPELIQVDETVRLRRFDGEFMFALDWYQDRETLLLVDGDETPYTPERLERMYRYLDEHGELYFIEVLEGERYRPIGDVTFWQDDMPIVIGEPEYRGKKIGRKIVAALIERGRTLGYGELRVREIYDYNTGSRRCFENCGFRSYEKTEKGSRYRWRENIKPEKIDVP